MTETAVCRYKRSKYPTTLLLTFAFFLICAPLLFGSDTHRKSLFLANMTPLINWPENSKAEFLICVFDDEAVFNSLQVICAGRHIKEKPIVISSLESNAPVSQCDILFVGEHNDSVEAWLHTFSDKPILTVSDLQELKEKGVMITMHTQGERIACTINQKSAQKAGLGISYILLESASEVIK